MRLAQSLRNSEDQDLDDGEGLMGDYIAMHDLGRHIIHISETIEAAATVVASAFNHIQAHQHKPDIANIISGIETSVRLLEALKLRSGAFRDRLQNEIGLVRIDEHRSYERYDNEVQTWASTALTL